jgi:hypothetical protein
MALARRTDYAASAEDSAKLQKFFSALSHSVSDTFRSQRPKAGGNLFAKLAIVRQTPEAGPRTPSVRFARENLNKITREDLDF